MEKNELIRIALSFLSANKTEAEDSLDIVIDSIKLEELETEYYNKMEGKL